MCRVFLSNNRRPGQDGFASVAERSYNALLRGYEHTLDWALAHRRLMLTVTLLTMVLSIVLYWIIPKGFFPQQDTGVIYGTTEAPVDISPTAMSIRQMALVRVVMDDPDVSVVYSWIGETSTPNNGRLVIALKPFAQRRVSAGQILARLRERAAQVPGISLRMQARQDLIVGGRASRTQFQYTLQDTDPRELYAWAPRLIDALRSLGQVQDLNSDLENPAPGTTIVLDRSRAAQFGISPQLLDDTLYDALGQRQVATIFTNVDQYHVVLEVDPKDKLDDRALDYIYVPSDNGKQIPLSVFARFEDSTAPLLISHQGQFPSVTISFNLTSGVALGDAVPLVESTIRGLRMPATLHGSFQGTAQAFKATLATQPYLIAAALIAMYIVLGILYESYVHPITILSTLPSAGLGALLALMLCHLELSLISLIGIILLIGIVKKNAIMMIDFALDAERQQGLDTEASIRAACLLRFRPIMMTTMAAIFGGLPLALGTGAGSEVRTPLGVAIVGGLLVSQVLTLYTTPVIYLYMDRLAHHISSRVARVWV